MRRRNPRRWPNRSRTCSRNPRSRGSQSVRTHQTERRSQAALMWLLNPTAPLRSSSATMFHYDLRNRHCQRTPSERRFLNFRKAPRVPCGQTNPPHPIRLNAPANPKKSFLPKTLPVRGRLALRRNHGVPMRRTVRRCPPIPKHRRPTTMVRRRNHLRATDPVQALDQVAWGRGILGREQARCTARDKSTVHLTAFQARVDTAEAEGMGDRAEVAPLLHRLSKATEAEVDMAEWEDKAGSATLAPHVQNFRFTRVGGRFYGRHAAESIATFRLERVDRPLMKERTISQSFLIGPTLLLPRDP